MKKFIMGLEHDWIAFALAVVGMLLIIFPIQLTVEIPFMLGAGLLVHAVISTIMYFKYKDKEVKIGKVVIYAVLGISILHYNGDAIGAIGGLWAMMSLYEVGEEINEMTEEKRFSVFRIIMSAISITLAVMLLFDPFEHFTTHVRVLGLEIISSVFVRRHQLIHSDKKV